jgi:hypothetical protein
VTHPVAGRSIDGFEVVHDKPFHLFVISQDMTVFQHVHPDLDRSGAWTIPLTLPKAGYYRLLADFVPRGGSPQFIGRTLVTAGYEGDLASEAARLEADALTRTEGTLTARVTLDPPTLIAGQYGHITYTLSDAATGTPVTDLEPYLGAFGHTLLLSGDMVDYVHSHPTEGPESDISRGFGGPTVTFEGYLPRPGLYRAWTQFQRRGTVTTIPFTFTVKTLDEAMREQRSAPR